MTRARGNKSRKGKTSGWRKFLVAFLLVLVGGGAYLGYELYNRMYRINVVDTLVSDEIYLEIPTGSSWRDLLKILQDAQLIENMASFEWVAQRANYVDNIKAGRYKLHKGMNNLEMVRLLRSGEQEPIRLVINKFRDKYDLYGAVARKIEADSAAIAEACEDPDFLNAQGLGPQQSLALIIPNTYEFWWNTSAAGFRTRMQQEFEAFWSAERREKAAKLSLQPVDVMILASIVEEETNKLDEKGTIAQVYLNRIRIGMRLQADPTVKFAIGDFSIKRITYKHLEYDSPFNTYIYAGLPPAPICTPSPQTIDAVLNSIANDYLYFCAKDDFSGYHAFAKSYREHQMNARKYHQALNGLRKRK